MKGKKITGAAILLFAGLALVLYFLKKDPLREVHALWEETMSRTEGAYVQTVTGSAWETKDAPGSENGAVSEGKGWEPDASSYNGGGCRRKDHAAGGISR